MANIQPRKNKDGKIISYSIRVHRGKNAQGKNLKPYSTTFTPNPKWSEAKLQKELQTASNLFEKECKEGVTTDNKQTFEQYFKYVLSLKERSGVKHETICIYKLMLERIIPGIGHLKLTDIKPRHLNQFYAQLAQDKMNLQTGGKLSNATIIKYHRLIRTILGQAEKELIVQYNAASKATPPKLVKKEANFLEIETIEQILSCLKNESLKWQVAISLLVFTGARRSELTGIEIKNIDFENNLIKFQFGTHYTKERGIYTDTLKTESSKRSLKIPADVMLLVKKLVKENKEKQILLGSKWENSGYLLVQENGKPIHPDSITTYCYKFRKRVNRKIQLENQNKPENEQVKLLPHINPHAFRHSQASMLIFSGHDIITVSKRLGHSEASTTSDIYGHILEKADEMAANTLENLLLKKTN